MGVVLRKVSLMDTGKTFGKGLSQQLNIIVKDKFFNLNHYCTAFYHSRALERAIYATVLDCKTEQKCRRKVVQQNGLSKHSKLVFFGIIRFAFTRICRPQ